MAEDKLTINDDEVGDLKDVLGENDPIFAEIEDDDEVYEDPFIDEEMPSIEQIAPAKKQYRIDGLSPEHERQALEMLDGGAPISDVCEYFGIARSDIAAVNAKK